MEGTGEGVVEFSSSLVMSQLRFHFQSQHCCRPPDPANNLNKTRSTRDRTPPVVSMAGTEQDADNTVRQAAGKEPIPPRGQPAYEDYQHALRFGYGARSEYQRGTGKKIRTHHVAGEMPALPDVVVVDQYDRLAVHASGG